MANKKNQYIPSLTALSEIYSSSLSLENECKASMKCDLIEYINNLNIGKPDLYDKNITFEKTVTLEESNRNQARK